MRQYVDCIFALDVSYFIACFCEKSSAAIGETHVAVGRRNGFVNRILNCFVGWADI